MKKITEIIEKVLNDMDFVYTKKNVSINESSHIFFVTNLAFNNKFLNGGVAYNESEEEITFMFFDSQDNISEKDEMELYKKINKLNEFMKYGKAYLDKDSLVYEMNVYIFENDDFEQVFRTYISTAIATAKSVFGDDA